MIEIDGSYREGGGQILRTSLSLSCLFQKPFGIFNIRKGRKKPGLMPQHLTAIRAAQLLSGAEVKGDSIGSAELSFSPGEVKGGDFFFDIGTAGSTSLALQTLIPAIALSGTFANPPLPAFSKGEMGRAGEKTTITLKGGTHVPFSPSFHYLAGVFSHFLKNIGVSIDLSIESYGFYPKGGGKVRAIVWPAERIRPLKVMQRGNIVRVKVCSCVGNLPLSIAERQKDAALKAIHEVTEDPGVPVEIDLNSVPATGVGTFLYLQAEYENSIAGFTSLGERGKRAEIVGASAAEEFLKYHSTGAALDAHMADQIVLYLAISGADSEFTTSCVTNHLLTNLWAIGLFHEFRYSADGDIGQPGKVRINQIVEDS